MENQGRIHKNTFMKESTRENMRMYWYKFSRNKLSVLGLLLVISSIVIAIFAPVIAPFPQHVEAFVDYNNASLAPSSTYWFGTDIFGRDILSRIIFAFRGALYMSIIVLAIAVPVGTLLGLIAGYFGGWFEVVIMRLTDIFLSIPAIILALSIASVLEPNLTSSMIAVTVMWWPWYTRMVAGMAKSYSKEYFIKNAELIGASKFHILFREILPNCISPILTKMALDVGWVMLIGATLSYCGLGEQPPTPAFGQMISDGSKYMPDLWWMTIYPAMAIAYIILGFNLLGDGISDMFNKGRQ
ncbi:ABC transporter permease [Fusibacter paucivorans]|uniref:ABC transporter permease n=1 Tax=Fusibacter paucivorans TaxID=76009 RepID=A0ABS5PQS7_9FIRM|nr:ABC transporter permease [Fusibacter paucivorans]MBS7527500.1 ABC transporter permease [Fusibacter paucivorans]